LVGLGVLFTVSSLKHTHHSQQLTAPPNVWVSCATAKPPTAWARPAEQPASSQAQTAAAVASVAPFVGRGVHGRCHPPHHLIYNTTSPNIGRKYRHNLCRPTTPGVQPPRVRCTRWRQNSCDLAREAVGLQGRVGRGRSVLALSPNASIIFNHQQTVYI
jgi:hypothetical protein